MAQRISSFTASAVHCAPSLTPKSVAQFNYDRFIGAGSHAFIYPVQVPMLPGEGNTTYRSFAVKMARENFSGDNHPIKREANLLRDMDHPNIVKVYASWKNDGVWCMAMDCFDCSVEYFLREGNSLDIGGSLFVLGELAKALAYMHEQGLAHGDVKLSNALIRGDLSQAADCSVALTDYDLTRPSGERLPGERERQVVGSMNYIPLNRLEGNAPLIRHDIYGAGCVAYELLGGALWSGRCGFLDQVESNMNALTSFRHSDERIRPLLHNMVTEEGSIRDGIDLVNYLKTFFPEINLAD